MELLNYKFKAIALTETWLCDATVKLCNIDGYNHISLPRDYSIRGGLSIFLDSKFSYKKKPELCQSNENIECLFIETKIVKKVLIGALYRPPGTSIKEFNKYLKIR